MNLKDFARGAAIIAAHEPDGYPRAAHDMVWLGSLHATRARLTDAERAELTDLGWEEDEDADGWYAEV